MTHEPIDYSDDSTDDPRDVDDRPTPNDDDLLDVLGHALRVADPVPGNVLCSGNEHANPPDVTRRDVIPGRVLAPCSPRSASRRAG